MEVTATSEPNPESPGRISARERRMAIAAGDSGSSAGIWMSLDRVLGVGRRPQHQLPGAPIVNPDRRAVGAEQAVGAVAEDVEPGGQLQRRRKALGELVEQQPQIGLHLVAPAQAGELERHQKRVGHRRDVGAERRRRRAGEADGDHADALAAAGERQQQRRAGVQTGREVGCLAIRVRQHERRAARERVGRRSPPRAGAGVHGSVGRASRPKPEVACIAPLRWLCSKSSNRLPPVTSSACWCSCGSRSTRRGVCASSETSVGGATAASRFRTRRRRTGGSVASFGRLGASVLEGLAASVRNCMSLSPVKSC